MSFKDDYTRSFKDTLMFFVGLHINYKVDGNLLNMYKSGSLEDYHPNSIVIKPVNIRSTLALERTIMHNYMFWVTTAFILGLLTPIFVPHLTLIDFLIFFFAPLSIAVLTNVISFLWDTEIFHYMDMETKYKLMNWLCKSEEDIETIFSDKL